MARFWVRLEECLVTVPEVGRQPAGCDRDLLVRPRAVREVDPVGLLERPVLGHGHSGGALGRDAAASLHMVLLVSVSCGQHDVTRDEEPA
jgi:hypothetical protein